LARLAADLGYTDQAHFTRDFRRVTGYAPGQFSRTLGRDARAP
jgi:AraC-like DNA-binding protein